LKDSKEIDMGKRKSCCAACAASEGHVYEAEPLEKHIHFGSYALPQRRVVIFLIALALWLAGLAVMAFLKGQPWGKWFALTPLLAAYTLAGGPVLLSAGKNIIQGRVFDENFLMAIATVGAFIIGEWEEAVGVMLFYMIGELVQEAAVLRSRSSIKALLALKPDLARVETADGWREVQADSVEIGTKIMVRPGERIPLDGIVLDGRGSVDASMLSGESAPVPRSIGDEVQSGTVSLDGVLVIRSIKTAENSSAARIIALVEKAKEAKAKPERFITAFARWYTPIVVGLALSLAVVPPLVTGEPFTGWIYRALILLVMSCPCALVVSVPLGYFAGIGGMSARGIMTKGAFVLDALRSVRFVAFDKTGTLTQGKFAVHSVDCANGYDEKTVLETAALAECASNHPIARAIRDEARERGIMPADSGTVTGGIREIAGHGIELKTGETGTILAGNRRLLETNGIPVTVSPTENTGEETLTPVYIAQNGVYYGRILVGDMVKPGAAEAVERLKKLNVAETVLLTGDAEGPARSVAAQLGISRFAFGLLPEDKLSETEKCTRRGITVFVGDGINDAPVLARSDVGIAMGSGADAAVEAADVIIMTGDPLLVPEAIERARKTRRIVIGNVIFALGSKAVFITLAVLGMANMWLALIADTGVALAAILNSTRALGNVRGS
jgi:Cd2+/Zn2+-exporting ATPase